MHRVERAICEIVRRKCFHLVYYNAVPRDETDWDEVVKS